MFDLSQARPRTSNTPAVALVISTTLQVTLAAAVMVPLLFAPAPFLSRP